MFRRYIADLEQETEPANCTRSSYDWQANTNVSIIIYRGKQAPVPSRASGCNRCLILLLTHPMDRLIGCRVHLVLHSATGLYAFGVTPL